MSLTERESMNYSTEIADYVPEGLSVIQYSLHILEEILGWPSKGNVELVADCLTALQKAKRLTPVTSYKYMVRAIRLAKDQGIPVDRMFFMNGVYSNVRPVPAIPSGTCDAECKAKHSRGYHENDVKWVMIKYFQEVKAGGSRTPEYFFKEIDSKRAGGPPEWKR